MVHDGRMATTLTLVELRAPLADWVRHKVPERCTVLIKIWSQDSVNQEISQEFS